MKIALDISPLSSGHKYRGTGFYTLYLKESLKKYFPEHTYTFFTRENQIPRDVDIIHYPYFDPFSFTIPFSRRKRTIVTILDLIPLLFPDNFPAGIKGNLKWVIQKYALRNIAGVITDSQSSMKDIKRIAGIKDEKIAVTYLAAGEQFRKISNERGKIAKIIREKYDLPDTFALYVGDVTWNKNLPRLVEAAIKGNVLLVMVGKALVNTNFDKTNIWNRDLEKVLQLAENNILIKRLGFVSDEDLVYLYNAATVCVMPSLYEGFGLPIVEAMQSGCPVITTKQASLPEVAGEAAYFVDPHSVNSMRKGIEEVMSSKSLQNDLSKKGIEQAKKFSWEITTKDTIEFYKKTLAQINI